MGIKFVLAVLFWPRFHLVRSSDFGLSIKDFLNRFYLKRFCDESVKAKAETFFLYLFGGISSHRIDWNVPAK